MVQEHLIELSVGETIQIGQYSVTLLDVMGEELCLEVDDHGQGNGAQGNLISNESELVEAV